MAPYIPLITLASVLALIAVRQFGKFRPQIWQIMLLGAAAVLVTGSIRPSDAVRSINIDVMLFLFGMFVVGEALVESGYLYHISYTFFKGARDTDSLVLLILFVMGFFSAFLMNDTVAIVGTPIAVFFADRHKISSKLLLLSLCFAVTLGSVVSPIGNPQNLLIAMGGPVADPFVTFFKYLAVPTFLNLLLAYFVLKIFYRGHFHGKALDNAREPVRDHNLAFLSKISLVIIFALVAVKIAAIFFWKGLDFRLTYIALLAAAPILALSPKRVKILKNIDWHTLVFFAAMFVLMESVWQSVAIQSAINGFGAGAPSVSLTLIVSVLGSQLLSNVPFVALYLPILRHAGAGSLMALAAGSTIAGNLLILGAASNIIVIQNAEKRGHTLNFLEFASIGAPLTVLNLAVYWVWLTVVG